MAALSGGRPQPTFLASLEWPSARIASGKCYAAASYLQHKYGMLQAKPDLSHILHVHHDEAGRSRGALLPPDLLPQSVREVMFNTPSQAPPAPELLNGPLTPSERTKLWSGLRHGAPGRSQFKLALVPHLGTEAVAAAESLIEAMLRTGLAPRILKGAMLVWASKSNGGLRGLSLLEELIKAPDAIMTRRLEVGSRTSFQAACCPTPTSASNGAAVHHWYWIW